MPFENSTHGVVTFTLDGLADRAGLLRDPEMAVARMKQLLALHGVA